ncbi:MAG: ATP-dependent DNA ligase [bacterium]|nr:ATP-dependent DNA ligase [bacterium]
MIFSRLAGYLERLEKTASRNEITTILADVFKGALASEIDKICYLVLGRISPHYTGIEFNLAEKMMVRAIAQAYNLEPGKVQSEYKRVGDLGDVVLASAKRRAKSAKLTVIETYEKLYKIAMEGGAGSQERKLLGISELLKSVDPLSAKYIARIPVGKLRLGFSDVTMLDALSVMEVGDKSARKTIEAVYSVTADIGAVAKKVKEKGIKGLGKPNAIPGVPIRSSLAERLANAEKIIEKVGPKVALEPKYDGFRVQMHIFRKGAKKEAVLFSRNHENVTHMFPDLVEAAKKLPITDAIFDSEAIGYDPKTDKFTPFQETVQRKRKYDIAEMAKKLPLKAFVFDILYLNGKTLINEPFSKRREILEKVLKGKSNTILVTEQVQTDDAVTLRELAAKYMGENLEGLMAKKIDAPYHAGGRGFHWVKYKKHTEGGLADTIDCVLMGAFRGRGRRAGFGVGGFLLGVPGEDRKFYTISNLGTGLTDEQFRQMNKTVEKLKVGTQPEEYVVNKLSPPDLWVKPEVVLEILADEITLSPRHTAGRTDSGRGYSLRFPRLIKIRTDKDPDQATSVHEMKELYMMQKKG